MYKSTLKKRFFLYIPAIFMILAIVAYCAGIFYLNIQYPVSDPSHHYGHEVFHEYVSRRITIREGLEKAVALSLTFAKYFGIILISVLPEPYFHFKQGSMRFLAALLIMAACAVPFMLLNASYAAEYALPLLQCVYYLLVFFILFSIKCLWAGRKRARMNGGAAHKLHN